MYISVCPLSRSFSDSWITYSVSWWQEISPWYVVVIPYGKQSIDAIVLEVDVAHPEIAWEIKGIITVKYADIFLYPYQIMLLHYVSKHYFSLMHSSLSLFLPRNLREKIKKETLVLWGAAKNYLSASDLRLSSVQMEKYTEIQESPHKINLFYGVTGSGKTRIYIELIKKYLSEDKQSLLLVPEIILSSQIAETISKTFWKDVLILNSSVSDAKKTKMRLSIHAWDAKIIIGTRSALFYPYKSLWIIIIDEEHDRSYKSDTNPRYDAREVASQISQQLNIPFLLWSGTPSITTMHKAITQEIWLITLLDEYK